MTQATTTLLITLFLFTFSAQSQHRKADEKAVRKIIHTLFDGMRNGDSSLVRPLFHPAATMGTIMTGRDGNTVYRSESSPAGFVSAVGSKHAEIWDERIGKIAVTIDADMAIATTPYSFYRGTTFSHCGVNAFTLVRLEGNWQIVAITDTRRKTDCPK
jgi:hypothetical protein